MLNLNKIIILNKYFKKICYSVYCYDYMISWFGSDGVERWKDQQADRGSSTQGKQHNRQEKKNLNILKLNYLRYYIQPLSKQIKSSHQRYRT